MYVSIYHVYDELECKCVDVVCFSLNLIIYYPPKESRVFIAEFVMLAVYNFLKIGEKRRKGRKAL